MEALDGKPLEVAVFGGQKSGKTQATGAPLSSLQPLINFENIFYGLGAGSDYNSSDNGTLRKFVHNDQVTVISSSADIGDLIDRAVSTNEKKVVVVDDIMQYMGVVPPKKLESCALWAGNRAPVFLASFMRTLVVGRRQWCSTA